MRRRRAQQLGEAAVTWAAVSLADKLDTVVGMFYAGEKPTGSRDPFGLRRQAHGIFKMLVDLPALTGLSARPALDAAARRRRPSRLRRSRMAGGKPRQAMIAFLLERYRYVLEQRGYDIRNVRAVLQQSRFAQLSPADALKRSSRCCRNSRRRRIFRSWPSPSSASRTSRASCRTTIHAVAGRGRAAARDSCSRNRRNLRCCKSSSGAAPRLTACSNRGKICAAHLSRQPSSVLQSIDSSPKSS